MNSLVFPVAEYLVPEDVEAPGDEYTLVEQKLMQGLPQRIELDADIHLYIIVPNGLANTWRDTEPTLLLSRGSDETLLHNPEIQPQLPNAERIPARLLIRRANEVKFSLPLVSGIHVVINASSAENPTLLEIKILDWDLRVGSLRDHGDYAASIRFCWRRIEKGIEKYSIPPVNPYVITRLKPVYRMESILGLRKIKMMSRFSRKQRMIKVVQ